MTNFKNSTYKLRSQILLPRNLYIFYVSSSTSEGLCYTEIKFWNYSTNKIFVTMHGKQPELYCTVLLLSNCMEKVIKSKRNYGTNLCPIFFFFIFSPQLEIKCSFEKFSTHGGVYVVRGKLLDLHFSALLSSNYRETVQEPSWNPDLRLQHNLF